LNISFPQKSKFKINHKIISLGILLSLFAFNFSPAYATNDNWINCDGSIDNDAAHHNHNPNDLDPAHHRGEVCVNNKEAWKSGTTVSVSSPATSQSNQNVIPAVSNSTVTNSNNPFANAKLYWNPNNDAHVWANNHRSDSYNASLMDKIGNQPEVEWLGSWNTNIVGDVTNMMNNITSQGALPVFVIYNIPNRDCGGYSAGGIQNSTDYQNWIRTIAKTIGNRKAAIILEPDGLSLIDCLSNQELATRYNLLFDAVNVFRNNGQYVYLDAGHPNWISANDMSNRLKAAGIANATGFALNTSNFFSTSDNINYGQQISSLTNNKHFVIDTGRNGLGPTSDQQWCNPSGRALGQRPTVNTGNALVDALLWVKGPGGSDGQCNGGPAAGIFWPEYALGLALRTNW